MSTMTSPVEVPEVAPAQKTPIIVRRELRQYASQLFKYTLKKLEETEGGHRIVHDVDDRLESRNSVDSNRSIDDNLHADTTHLQNGGESALVGV